MIRGFLATFLFAVAFLACAFPVTPDLLVTSAFHSGDDPVLVYEINQAANRVVRQFPEVQGMSVTSGPLAPDVYASTNGQTITFNRFLLAHRGLAEMMFYDDVETGFHPKLGHCTPLEMLAFHESGHVIDNVHQKAADVTLASEYGDRTDLPLSKYSFANGALNPPEALAEAFAAVMCNGGSPVERELSKLLTQ